MPRVFSGIQPTGDVHLGNWIGAISRWAADQEDGHVFCIVDLHAITIPKDPEHLRTKTRDLAAWILAAGLDPEVATLFVQSHVREHSELAWVLSCSTQMGELNRMVQFKEKSARSRSAPGCSPTPCCRRLTSSCTRPTRCRWARTSASTSS